MGAQPRLDPNEDAFDTEADEEEAVATAKAKSDDDDDVEEEEEGEAAGAGAADSSSSDDDEEDILPSPLSIRQQRTNQTLLFLNSTSAAASGFVKSVDTCALHDDSLCLIKKILFFCSFLQRFCLGQPERRQPLHQLIHPRVAKAGRAKPPRRMRRTGLTLNPPPLASGWLAFSPFSLPS